METLKFGIMTFKDFLCESIKPIPVSFGIDFNNKQWKELDKDFKVSFFKSNNEIFVVVFRQGHIGFGIAKKDDFSQESCETFSDLQKYFWMETTKSRASSAAGRVFGEVFYVILDIIKKENPKEIYFNAFKEDLKALYDYLLKTKLFKLELEKIGYSYKGFGPAGGQTTPVHTFERS